jgi:hypothetical protein
LSASSAADAASSAVKPSEPDGRRALS